MIGSAVPRFALRSMPSGHQPGLQIVFDARRALARGAPAAVLTIGGEDQLLVVDIRQIYLGFEGFARQNLSLRNDAVTRFWVDGVAERVMPNDDHVDGVEFAYPSEGRVSGQPSARRSNFYVLHDDHEAIAIISLRAPTPPGRRSRR